MCDIPSTNPPPVFADDKPRLNKLCLNSFINAFMGIDYTGTVICDYCNPETIELLERTGWKIIQTSKGIDETMHMSYEIARESNDDIILFQECDYLYRPGVGAKYIEAIKKCDLVSPYDHPDFYSRFDIHPHETNIIIQGNQHYRFSTRNTMTFGLTKKVLTDGFDHFMRWGYLDNEIWVDLQRLGYLLWTPIPSFSTHMVKDYLAPGVDWESLWKI